jgi:hypothetical protein
MNISAISMNNANTSAAFQAKEKPLYNITPNTPDDQVVGWSTWGENYPIPITAGQVRREEAQAKEAAIEEAKQEAARKAAAAAYKESPEDAQARYLRYGM